VAGSNPAADIHRRIAADWAAVPSSLHFLDDEHWNDDGVTREDKKPGVGKKRYFHISMMERLSEGTAIPCAIVARVIVETPTAISR